MNIFEKLANIQNRLKAPKGQFNSFGKYNYRSCEDILEAVKPLCLAEKTALTLTDEIVLIGTRYYLKALATLTDCDKPDDKITVSAFAREEEEKKGMDGSQVTGASSSYARKYALNGLFNIDDTKDSDSTNNGDKPNNGVKNSVQETKPVIPKMTQEQRLKLSELNVKVSDVATYYKCTESEITEAQAADIIKRKTEKSNLDRLKIFLHNDNSLMAIAERLIPSVAGGKKLADFDTYEMGQLFLAINKEVREK